MPAADVIEKVTLSKPEYLNNHKEEIIALSDRAKNKELMWHLAQLLSRLKLNKKELEKVWTTLSLWALDKLNSRIVRVCSIQSLYDLSNHQPDLMTSFLQMIEQVKKENIPSLNARIRRIEKGI